MPEGPTVHRYARDHERTFARKLLHADSPNGRSTPVARAIDGRRLRGIDAIGKHLFYIFGADRQLHVHLGRFGNFTSDALPLPAVTGILRLRLWNTKMWLELRGAITIDVIDALERAAIESRLGPDPLRANADPAIAYERIIKSRSSIAQVLMDQSVVAGIGNIYRSELLFRAGIHPQSPSRSLAAATWRALWLDMRRLMEDAVERGRIVTTDPGDRARPKRVNVAADDRFYVYRRTERPCRRCGTPIQTAVIGARNVFWCPRDQPA